MSEKLWWNELVPCTLLVRMQRFSHFGKQLAVSYEVRYTLTRWSGSPFLDVYLRGMKMYVHTKTWTWLFIAALFIIAKTGSNLYVFQLVNGYANCGLSIHSMEYCSAMERNKLLVRTAISMDLKHYANERI